MNTTTANIIIAIALLAATEGSAQVLQSDANPPSLLELCTIEPASESQPTRYLFIFKTEKAAKGWTTAIGYTLIGAGAYLGGQAEYFSRYHGTRRNGDAFHTTRDASLILTGLGSASLGASVTIGSKPRPLEILWKLTSGAILYRIIAETTYNQHKPR